MYYGCFLILLQGISQGALSVGVGCTEKNGEDFSKGPPMSRGRFKGYPLTRIHIRGVRGTPLTILCSQKLPKYVESCGNYWDDEED